MYKLDLEIPDGVYDYLVKWGLSNGYAVDTNEDHTILYGLSNRDPVVDLKAWKEGTAATATEEEALNLIANLAHLKENEAIPYAPVYSPQIRVHEEMYLHHFFISAKDDKNWAIEAHHEGIFWFIQRVREEGASNILCRSEVTAFIRSLEYKRLIAPFVVMREKGSQSKTWEGRTIDSLKKALAVVQREKDRHAPGDWKVWEDVTAEARTLPAPAVMDSEAGFMVRGFFPGAVGAEHWEKSYYEELIDALVRIVKMQEFEPDAICAIYACRYHEALEEEKAEPHWNVIAYPAFLADVDAIENGGICLIWKAHSAEEVCVLATRRAEDIEAADLEPLSSLLRGKLTAGADRLMLFTFHKALKIENGIQFERFAGSEVDLASPRLQTEEEARC